MGNKSILYIWLPCKKVYPAGPTSLASYVHQKRPNVQQRMLDLSLIDKGDRLKAITGTVEEFKPDIIAFSWRDVQIYAPHGEDDSLELAFNFYYSPNVFKKLSAGIRGISMVFTYENHLKEKLYLIKKTIRKFPDKTHVIGGGAFSVFHNEIITSLPEGVIGVIGEGEDVIVSLIDGTDYTGYRVAYRKGGKVIKGKGKEPVLISDMRVDYQYIESIFPQAPSYFGGTIGIQTKRGCPYNCEFCLYSFIEGPVVRYRDPENIIAEISYLYSRWNVRKLWFADAQFIPGSQSLRNCTALLEGVIKSGIPVEWSGYVRTSLITQELADLMVSSGVGDLEVSVTSGSQSVLNEMSMGFKLENLYEGCRYLKKAGYRGKIILNYSINAPGETEETLLESINSYKSIVKIMGREQVQCVIFFLGVQPHTGLEKRLIENGYLSNNYNPIALNPFTIKKLLYNPPPLDKVIARSCLDAWKDGGESGERIMHNLEKRLTPR
ncbi:MAG: radical SAM protein [Nitrospirae bacterium]|nr:radical SAM protein [Nitrospirota bacterium]